jgi:hypothetical protein
VARSTLLAPLVLVVAAMLAACSTSVPGLAVTGGSNPAAAPSSPAAAFPEPTTGPSQSSSSGAGLGLTLQKIALQTPDVAAGHSLQLIQGGDQVAGQVTLDNCGYNFTTEQHRVARRQYGLMNGADITGLSNEVVAYDSAAEAAKAVAQWRASVTHCPTGLVHSTVAGEPDLRMRITTNESRQSSLPVADNAITRESGTTSGQVHVYFLAVLQAKGRFLDNVYLEVPRPITATEMQVVLTLARDTGRRLAALG